LVSQTLGPSLRGKYSISASRLRSQTFPPLIAYQSRQTRRDLETGVWKYNDGKIFTVTNVAAIIVSALLPTSSMLILFCLDKIVVKLAVIFIYTILFALALAIVVRARSIEIFGAATA
jgi:hypothetical protein